MSDAITEGKNRIIPGAMYRHFKGGLYVVIGVLKCSDNPVDINNAKVHYVNLETGEHYHRNLYGEDGWLTPKILNGRNVTRFTFVGYATVNIDQRGKFHVTREL